MKKEKKKKKPNQSKIKLTESESQAEPFHIPADWTGWVNIPPTYNQPDDVFLAITVK